MSEPGNLSSSMSAREILQQEIFHCRPLEEDVDGMHFRHLTDLLRSSLNLKSCLILRPRRAPKPHNDFAYVGLRVGDGQEPREPPYVHAAALALDFGAIEIWAIGGVSIQATLL